MKLFKKKLNQNEILLKNLEIYEQKEKAEQQQPEVLGQKQVKQKANKEKRTSVHNSSRL